MTDHDTLVEDLARLGRGAPVPPPSAHLATAVLERVATLPTPAPAEPAPWVRRVTDAVTDRVTDLGSRWQRRVVVAVVALLVALLATPPVRAAVADWFGFAGVIVQRGPSTGDDAPPPPAVDDALTVAEAAELVAFTPMVPGELGEPDAVDVSADRVILSMSWSTAAGPVRLDQFDGRLDFRIAKTSPGVLYANVAGNDALWFEEPHEVVILDDAGRPRTESARLAGHTLIWPVGDVTMRLEGDLSLDRAVEIGSSTVPYDG
jgi:hypothetical protein